MDEQQPRVDGDQSAVQQPVGSVLNTLSINLPKRRKFMPPLLQSSRNSSKENTCGDGFRSLSVQKAKDGKAMLPQRPSVVGAKVDNKNGNPNVAQAIKGRCFRVLYTNYNPMKKRKNKRFMDGVLMVGGSQGKHAGKALLFSEDAKQIGSKASSKLGVEIENIGAGSEIVIGSWEVEVDVEVSEEEYERGSVFLQADTVGTSKGACSHGQGEHERVMSRPEQHGKVPCKQFLSHARKGGVGKSEPKRPRIVYNPDAKGAVVLNHFEWSEKKHAVSPVVLDPMLKKKMRPHQIEGVQFLYDCICGKSCPGYHGAILADAMGLGKTLTTLALLYTILKQGPNGNSVVKKAMVVAPSSLTRGWSREVKKWFGDERLRSCVIESGPKGAQQALEFRVGSVSPLAFISYETLRQHATSLAGSIGIIVADEGHRLKSAGGNKTIAALQALKCKRRIILTGTPVQNNLSELFSMIDFVNPGLLGPLQTFSRIFDVPITKSREKHASDEELSLGRSRSEELKRIMSAFVIRRDASINEKFLPKLTAYAVFCKPTQTQVSLVEGVIRSRWTSDLYLRDDALVLLTELRKVCNHPMLLRKEGVSETEISIKDSGKSQVLMALLQQIVCLRKERMVVVSQSTAMLDIIQKICNDMNISTCRLDGSTSVSKRQDIVHSFNCFTKDQVFLLSTAAGGAGLNLIGANHLCLFDSHWNPALDSQAMARIWRDGQKKDCFVYRLITTGTVEEKIYQRQRMKGDLANVTISRDEEHDGSASEWKTGGSFSKEELKELFNLKVGTSCLTSEVLTSCGQAYEDASETCSNQALKSCVDNSPITFIYTEIERGRNKKSSCSTEAPKHVLSENEGGPAAAPVDASQLEINEDF